MNSHLKKKKQIRFFVNEVSVVLAHYIVQNVITAITAITTII